MPQPGSLSRRLRKKARAAVESSRMLLSRIRWGSSYGRLCDNLDRGRHLREAVDWLKRAQDAGSDRGVSYGAPLGGTFLDSYPETTGYIIVTFLDLADYFGEPEFERRAIEMGDWEIDIQMKCGAVMGGRVNENPTPAIFNTGQVLLGWAALFRRTNDQRFLVAARRAAQWLVEIQEPDGNWNAGNSQFAHQGTTVYNVKAAWGLLAAAMAMEWGPGIDAAIRNADFCVSRQHANGWFEDCCLSIPGQPWSHTLAYTMQGLVGIGLATGRAEYVSAAEKTARSMMQLMDDSGFIPARIDADFRGTVPFCCLTGTAQVSHVWSQLYTIGGDLRFANARTIANRYLMARHNIDGENQAIRGGVFGSWPIWEDYGRSMVLNWAAKFFVDALLIEERQTAEAGGAQ